MKKNERKKVDRLEEKMLSRRKVRVNFSVEGNKR